MRWSIRARVLFASLTILILLLVFLGTNLSQRAEEKEQTALKERLAGQGQALAVAGGFVISQPEPDTIFAGLARDALSQDVEVVIIRADGAVLYVSEGADPLHPLTAPEVQEALAGRVGYQSRPSQRTGIRRLFVAVPIRGEEIIVGAVQVSAPAAGRDSVAREVIIPLVIGGAAAAAVALLLGYFLTTPWQRSMRHITSVAKRLAQGQLSERVEQGVVAETTELASSLNTMAESLERQVRLSYEERDTFGAVIQTMADALLVTDADGVVTIVNRAASQLFHFEQSKATGATFIEVVRDHEIAQIFQRARETGRQESGQVGSGIDLRLLRVVATPVEEKGKAAVLVIIQDLTDVQRLQDMRREFVANVSHELRTPLASIKASVEALQAGALDERTLAEDFLRRMNTEVDALTDMVQHLMEL
ncbi:MAG: multi-sensor signal transduction histidine kinase, partial [Dehalococcoidia bacterium]|nr:multi-sensor signal transduction histidine kinase [Dehalococcoidia bacterium]